MTKLLRDLIACILMVLPYVAADIYVFIVGLFK